MRHIIFSGILSLVMYCTVVQPLYAKEYRILALRVDFIEEDPDHYTTSGVGKFDLSNYYEDADVQDRYYHPWDIPPHDNLYFAHHLTALDTYWRTVSDNKISISFDIWPKTRDGAYTMTEKNKFYKYGNGRTDEETYRKLVELFREAVTECKKQEGDNIDFSEYDTFLIIHAGIGSETSGVLNDIPSAFIDKTDIEKYAKGLKIDGMEFDNGIIVPEMISQTGTGGLNGLLAQMFGYRLGLPSMSNNEDGLPGAGGWCLMDTGSMAWGYSTRGFVPTHPCIWSKIELGIVEPVVVTSDTTIDIAATHVSTDMPKALKISITGDEYLLVENRYRPVSRDSLAIAEYSDENSSGVWLGGPAGSAYYESYIPGSGILIWHINESIIKEKRGSGAINNDPYRRGIDLLEADSQEDIGALFSIGDDRSEYAEGWDGDTYKSNGDYKLSPYTRPNSGSMWGGESGITVQVLDEPGEVMRVSVSFSGKMEGFPVSVGSAQTVTAVDLNGDDIDELITTDQDSLRIVDTHGTIIFRSKATGAPAAFKYNSSGKNYLAVPVDGSLEILGMNGSSIESIKKWETIFKRGYLVSDGSVLSRELSSTAQLLVGERFVDNGITESSRIYIIEPMEFTGTQVVSLPDTAHIRSMASANDFVAVLGENNTLYFGNIPDEELKSFTIDSEEVGGPVLADLDRDDSYEVIVSTDRNLLIYRSDGTYDTAMFNDSPVGAPIVADLDDDGYPEIIQSTEKQVCAFRNKGIPVNGFPFDLPPGDSKESIVSQPIVADMNNDGTLDIAITTSNMRMIVYRPNGIVTNGFPLTLQSNVTNTTLIFKRAASDSIALAYVTTDGQLMAHDLGTVIDDDLYVWPMYGGNASLTSTLLNGQIASEVQATAPFECYCYPNPITGTAGRFRITPTESTDCTITVYTADGRQVFKHYLSESELSPGVPNEISMDASELASGLYIARIKTRQNTVIYKLGVLK